MVRQIPTDLADEIATNDGPWSLSGARFRPRDDCKTSVSILLSEEGLRSILDACVRANEARTSLGGSIRYGVTARESDRQLFRRSNKAPLATEFATLERTLRTRLAPLGYSGLVVREANESAIFATFSKRVDTFPAARCGRARLDRVLFGD